MKKHVLTSIVTILTATSASAQTILPAPPVLVIGITIDQLRTDYVETFSDLFGEGGFKRLWKEGRVYRNAQYPFDCPDRASAVASVYSGTVPARHGIIAEQLLNKNTFVPFHCADDPAFMGYYTDQNSSPAQLLASTLTDELKAATRDKAQVYALSPFRDAAIFAAGHSADGAFWINENTGKWCGTTYYKDLPYTLNQYNEKKALNLRIDSLLWTPVLPENRYTHLTSEWDKATFEHKFDGIKTHKYKRFITSPLVNDEVNALAKEFINGGLLGQDSIPDILSLTYYAGAYNNMSTLETALETQDAYVRLDKSIAYLLQTIDKKFGLHNVLLFVTSTGYTDIGTPDLNKYKIPTGEFYLNRCAALLNLYLSATYGDGRYVEAYHNRQIYLNRKLIENKQLSLTELQDKSADFLLQFSGVSEAYSAHRLLAGAWSPRIQSVRNGFHRERSGDVTIEVLPGWVIVNENPLFDKVVRDTYISTPLIFMGAKIAPDIIHTPVSTECIAPTLAYIMRIRAPNACRTAPLTEIQNNHTSK